MEALGRAIKVAFSSKGKRSQPGGGEGGRKRAGVSAAPAAAVDEEEMSLDDSGILPADEPMPELGGASSSGTATPPRAGGGGSTPAQRSSQVEMQEPATAPIPTSSLSRKTKLVLVALIVLSVVGVGVGIAVMGRGEEEARARKMADLYDRASASYDAGNYAKAADTFEQLVSKYSGTLAARKASILMHLAKGRVAVDEKDWAKAAAQGKSAKEELLDMQRNYERQSVVEWTRAIDSQIARFEDYYTKIRAYNEVVDRVEVMIADERFREARTELRKIAVEVGGGWPGFRERHQELLDRISRMQFTKELNEAVTRADELAEQNQFATAKTAYADAIELLEEDERADLLAEDVRKERLERLTARRDEMESFRAYSEAMAEANEARDTGNHARELEWLKKAKDVRESDELAQRIKQVESDYYLQVANRALSDGQQAQAQKLYQRALDVNPDNQRAKSALNSLKENAKYAALVAAGDTARVSGDWGKALEKYLAARQIQAGRELDEKIVTCRFQIQLAKANKLRADGEYEKAKTAYEKAAAIKESEAAMVESLQVEMAQEVNFKELMTKAKTLLEQGSYKQAIEQYEKAGNIYATTPEVVEEGIRRCKYEVNMKLGREALADDDRTLAKSYFKLAQAQLDTAEVRKALADLGEASPQ
jgi:tetratricopeptide (TPR) repeat protein